MFGKGFLGDIGTRLQRILKFDGSADASFDSKAIPVMIVGDATLPGYGDQQGRVFNVFSSVALNQYFYIRATQDVIITRIFCTLTSAAAGSLTMQLVAPGTADPGSSVGGQFMDRSLSASDRPPLRVVTNATPTAGATFANWFATAASLVGQDHNLDLPFCLSNGQALVFTSTNPSFNVGVWGQVL